MCVFMRVGFADAVVVVEEEGIVGFPLVGDGDVEVEPVLGGTALTGRGCDMGVS